MKLSLLIAAATALTVSAECPNACSGRGECGLQDQCVCYAGYTAADCSQRVCAFGLSFVDTPAGDLNHDGQIGGLPADRSGRVSVAYSSVQWASYMQSEYWPKTSGANSAGEFPASAFKSGGKDLIPGKVAGGGWAAAANEAHFYSECSGKGTCSRDTGACACYDGFTGAACQRTTCPNDCSGHGLCRSVAAIAAGALNKQLLDSAGGVNTYAGVSTPFEYRLWDAEKNQACVCDAGYSGVDCSLRECPRGDDPLTNVAATCNGEACRNEVQGFTISNANDGKSYRISFKAFSGATYTTSDFLVSTDPAKQADNAEAVKAALEALPNNVAGTVKVTSIIDDAAACNSGHVRITVAFTTLSGNVPDFTVMLGSANAGTDPVVQPGQAVQCMKFDSFPTKVKVSTFPVDGTGFRSAQFEGTEETLPGTPTDADLASALSASLAGSSALSYLYGATPVTVKVDGKIAMLVFKDKNFGTNPVKVETDAPVSAPEMDAFDGNTEHSVCSNRGLCDYSAGLCACFPGYVGPNCDTQSTLAM